MKNNGLSILTFRDCVLHSEYEEICVKLNIVINILSVQHVHVFQLSSDRHVTSRKSRDVTEIRP